MKKITSLFVGLLLVVPSFGQIAGGGAGGIGSTSLYFPDQFSVKLESLPGLSISTQSPSQKDIVFNLIPITPGQREFTFEFSDLKTSEFVDITIHYEQSNGMGYSPVTPILLPPRPPLNSYTLSSSEVDKHDRENVSNITINVRFKAASQMSFSGWFYRVYRFTFKAR